MCLVLQCPFSNWLDRKLACGDLAWKHRRRLEFSGAQPVQLVRHSLSASARYAPFLRRVMGCRRPLSSTNRRFQTRKSNEEFRLPLGCKLSSVVQEFPAPKPSPQFGFGNWNEVTKTSEAWRIGGTSASFLHQKLLEIFLLIFGGFRYCHDVSSRFF